MSGINKTVIEPKSLTPHMLSGSVWIYMGRLVSHIIQDSSRVGIVRGVQGLEQQGLADLVGFSGVAKGHDD